MLSRSSTVRLAALTLLMGLSAPVYAGDPESSTPFTVANLEIVVWADLAKPIANSTHAHASDVDVEAGTGTKVTFKNKSTVWGEPFP